MNFDVEIPCDVVHNKSEEQKLETSLKRIWGVRTRIRILRSQGPVRVNIRLYQF